MKNNEQPSVSVHAFNISRYNVLPGMILFYQVGCIRVLFEAAYDPKTAFNNEVTIEPGSCLYLSGKKISLKERTISKLRLSWPTTSEINKYRRESIGI